MNLTYEDKKEILNLLGYGYKEFVSFEDNMELAHNDIPTIKSIS